MITWGAASTNVNGVNSVEIAGPAAGSTYNISNATPGFAYSTDLTTGTGNDAVFVTGTAGSLHITNGGGSDSVVIGSNAPSITGGTLAGITGPITVDGTGSSALIVDDSGDTSPRTITFANSELTGLAPAAISYTSVVTSLTVNGGSGGNDFVVQAAPSGAKTTFNGGTGVNTLTGPNVNETWTVSSAGGGTLGSSILFTGMHSLLGGSLSDTFKFTGSGSIAGTINGGAGTGNKIDYSALTMPVSVNLQTRTAPLIDGGVAGGFSNIEALAGSKATTNTLTGLDADTAWTISSVNSGKAGPSPSTGPKTWGAAPASMSSSSPAPAASRAASTAALPRCTRATGSTTPA